MIAGALALRARRWLRYNVRDTVQFASEIPEEPGSLHDVCWQLNSLVYVGDLCAQGAAADNSQ